MGGKYSKVFYTFLFSHLTVVNKSLEQFSVNPLIDPYPVKLQYLIDNQASEFLLFTIEFTGTNYGSSSVAFDSVLLGDQDGNEITDVDFNSARITVNNPNAVPEPSALGILFAGFAFMAFRTRKARSTLNRLN